MFSNLIFNIYGFCFTVSGSVWRISGSNNFPHLHSLFLMHYAFCPTWTCCFIAHIPFEHSDASRTGNDFSPMVIASGVNVFLLDNTFLFVFIVLCSLLLNISVTSNSNISCHILATGSGTSQSGFQSARSAQGVSGPPLVLACILLRLNCAIAFRDVFLLRSASEAAYFACAFCLPRWLVYIASSRPWRESARNWRNRISAPRSDRVQYEARTPLLRTTFGGHFSVCQLSSELPDWCRISKTVPLIWHLVADEVKHRHQEPICTVYVTKLCILEGKHQRFYWPLTTMVQTWKAMPLFETKEDKRFHPWCVDRLSGNVQTKWHRNDTFWLSSRRLSFRKPGSTANIQEQLR